MGSGVDILRLRLLGTFAAYKVSDSLPVAISSRKARAILAYLAMHAGEPVDRDQLADLVWEARKGRDVRHNLRQSLVELRKALDPFPGLVVVSRDAICLQSRLCQVDAMRFAEFVEAGDLEKAAALHQGEFLKNLHIQAEAFTQWVASERSRLSGIAGRLFEMSAQAAVKCGDGKRAIILAEKLTALDPLREDWQRLLMQVYAKFLGRQAAIGHARALVALLKRDLDVTPEPETLALIDRIRHGEARTLVDIESPLLAG